MKYQKVVSIFSLVLICSQCVSPLYAEETNNTIQESTPIQTQTGTLDNTGTTEINT
jgi:hypothetical protein